MLETTVDRCVCQTALMNYMAASMERRSLTSRNHGSKISGSQQSTIRSLSNDDGDGNENSKKKQQVYVSNTTTLHVHHALLYIA